MRLFIVLLLVLVTNSVLAQSIEKIEIPKGVAYKYCDSATYANAKSMIIMELSDSLSYKLNSGVCFIGPVLWGRYAKIPALNNIKGGDLTILGYKKETSKGKLTQRNEDFKLVWDQLRSEIHGKEFTLRKATVQELTYYWSVISFDIIEPLIIIQTTEHNYILNLSPKDFTLAWLDEAPRNN